ncbi:hypothetical protein [Rufibacter sp. XAAS-G3-1]|uniref:hypothetical protein n=1 Tax=Rufibacter sp. XAAS-G3-1 TaxID=2729134 RepID=UPI0015E6C421|nr:hypothetical protein [Rufibacter sp. XAAS-G3-1]
MNNFLIFDMKTTFTILFLIFCFAGLVNAQDLEVRLTDPPAELPVVKPVAVTTPISKAVEKVAEKTEKAAKRAEKAFSRATAAAESGESVGKEDEADEAKRLAAKAQSASDEATAAATALRANPDKSHITEAKKAMKKANKTAKAAQKAADEAFDKLLVIDFQKKLPPEITLGNIEEGEFFRIRIDSINQNIWKVSLTKSDSVLSKRQETPTFGSLQLDVLAKLIGGIGPFSSTTSSPLVDPSAFKKMDIYGIDFDGVAKRYSAVEDSIKAEMERIDQYSDGLIWATQSIDNLKLAVYERRLQSLKLNNPRNDEFDFTKALKYVQQIRTHLSQMTEEISKTEKRYEAFSEKNATSISANPEFAKADKIIKEKYAGYGTALTTIQGSISADKTNELLAPLVSIENNKINSYTSLPIQFMGEQTKVQLTIVPRNDALNQHSHSIPITFPTVMRKYISAGMSFYTANIYDRAFSTTENFNPADSSSTFTFDKENVDKVEIGLAAMLRFGKKIGEKNNFGYHASIGAGVSVANKIKPRGLFGGGLSFGKKHMLALDGGLIAGYVDKHSDKIVVGESYPKVPGNLTVSRIDTGWFLSIGYLYQF